MKTTLGKGAHLTAYTDESLENGAENGRRSHPELLLKYGNVMVAEVTNLQKCISLSFAKAEYVVL